MRKQKKTVATGRIIDFKSRRRELRRIARAAVPLPVPRLPQKPLPPTPAVITTEYVRELVRITKWNCAAVNRWLDRCAGYDAEVAR